VGICTCIDGHWTNDGVGGAVWLGNLISKGGCCERGIQSGNEITKKAVVGIGGLFAGGINSQLRRRIVWCLGWTAVQQRHV